MHSRVGWWGLGSMVSALLASACCWLPLVLLLFGASAAGVAGFFESYRPWFLTFATLLLAGGFYTVYFRRNECAPGSGCAVPRPGLQRFNHTMLWIATAATLTFAAFPNYAGYFLQRGSTVPAIADVSGTPLELNIQGMTCEACASGLQETLRRVPGVRFAAVDYQGHSARLVIDPVQTKVVQDAALLSIQASGYHASLAASSSN